MTDELIIRLGENTEISSNPDTSFDIIVRYLNKLAHEIEDIAAVASRLIVQRRNEYNGILLHNKLFLKSYTFDRLKRDQEGNVTGKSHKSLTAGGGVFFRQKPEKITLNEEHLEDMKAFIEKYLPVRTDLIIEKKIFEVPDKKALIEALQEIADKKAEILFTEPEDITVAQIQGLNEIYKEFDIDIEDADPYYYMYVGTTKANTFRSVKDNLTQAVNGAFKYEPEKEIDILLEELSGEEVDQ